MTYFDVMNTPRVSFDNFISNLDAFQKDLVYLGTFLLSNRFIAICILLLGHIYVVIQKKLQKPKKKALQLAQDDFPVYDIRSKKSHQKHDELLCLDVTILVW